MKIENGSLIVEVAGVEVMTALPAVSTDATVKVWRVPTAYQALGLFVAVTLPGQPEEIPACDMAATHYLGELTLKPSDTEKLRLAKAAKRQEINTGCDTAIAALPAAYPEREVQSWPQQVKEAESLAANPQTPTPLLSAIAVARGLPATELAHRVLANMTAYSTYAGAIIGRRQALEDALDAALTVDQVNAIAWQKT